MIGERIEDFGAGENMETDEHDVVEEQHDCGEFIGNLALAEDVVAEIANVFDLGVLHDVFVHSNGGDPEERASHEHGDDTRNPSQNAAERVLAMIYRAVGASKHTTETTTEP